MEKLLMLIFIFLVVRTSGQEYYVGIGTGGSYWAEAASLDDRTLFKEKKPTAWENGIFFRYESRRWFALETSVSYSAINLMPQETWCTVCHRSENRKDKLFTFSLNWQSRFTNARRKLQQFIGWSLLYGIHSAQVTDAYSLKRTRENYRYGGAGLNHLILYSLLPRWELSLKTGFHAVLGNSLVTGEEGSLRFASSLGVAYKL